MMYEVAETKVLGTSILRDLPDPGVCRECKGTRKW